MAHLTIVVCPSVKASGYSVEGTFSEYTVCSSPRSVVKEFGHRLTMGLGRVCQPRHTDSGRYRQRRSSSYPLRCMPEPNLQLHRD
jgi:hypothetical protein